MQKVVVNASKMEVNISGLEECVEYSIFIRAFTVAGGGPFSPRVTKKTFEDSKYY